MAPPTEEELKLAERLRKIRHAASALCPPDSAREFRMIAVDTRLNYVRARADGIDAIDIGQLVKKFPDCQFHVRDKTDGAALDIYIPTRAPAAARAMLMGSRAMAFAAVGIVLLAAWMLLHSEGII
jgi:hypothetical protein